MTAAPETMTTLKKLVIIIAILNRANVNQIEGFIQRGMSPSFHSKNGMTRKEFDVDVARQKLEKGYTKQIFSRKPLKLDYKTSRRWIQRNWNPKTKEEFYDLVANGNLRTPYISKRPEEYYGERGEWVSWDHYLLVTDEDDEKNGTDSKQITKWG